MILTIIERWMNHPLNDGKGKKEDEGRFGCLEMTADVAVLHLTATCQG
jgi:hypothetical protein